MREQLIKYVELLFAGTPDADDIRQEILQNTLDRYDDLIHQGKSPEAAYRLAISGIGDINEILSGREEPSETTEVNTDRRGRPLPSGKQKVLRAIAIALYICCIIPVILLGNIADGIFGVCLMFLMIAAATALIILASDSSKETKSEVKKTDEPKTELGKTIKSIWGIVTLAIYLGISFWTGAWYITWLIFPIMAALQGLINAILDLKEAKKHET